MSNKQLIAKIKLALGQIGFYDETSGVYLTQQNPSANIYAGTNCIKLSEAVKENKLILVEGTLVPSRVKQILKIKQEILRADKAITEEENTPIIPQSDVEDNTNEDVAELNSEPSTETIESSEPTVDEVNYTEKAETTDESSTDNDIVVTVDGEELTNPIALTVGESKVIDVNIENPVFKSSSTSVVSITKKGKMTARGEGEAYIYIITDNEEKKLFDVIVNAPQTED